MDLEFFGRFWSFFVNERNLFGNYFYKFINVGFFVWLCYGYRYFFVFFYCLDLVIYVFFVFLLCNVKERYENG